MTDGGSGAGWTVTGETLRCVHCGGHWIMQPGSGRVRGFCTRCMGVVCGMRQCFSCVPEEQMLLNMEAAGRARMEAAIADAEEASELVCLDDANFTALVSKLYTARSQGIEYRSRMDANIRAIRGG